MLINCKNCNEKSIITEVQELNDINGFTDRLLFIGNCGACNHSLATLVEFRISDDKVFIDNFSGSEADKVIKREKRRLKNKQVYNDDIKFHGWVCGCNVERKNKKGKVTSIRQYACDFRTGRRRFEKLILTNKG